MLEVRLLGQFKLSLNGKPFDISSRPAQSLFAYLILNAGSRHRREKLAGLLWPVSTESNARNNLRQALWRIRKALQQKPSDREAYILADNFTVGFNQDTAYRLDASDLEQEIPRDWSADHLMRILSVYEGELLPGFYEDWIVLERERLRAIYEIKVQLLLDRLVLEEQWRDVVEWGERWIATGEAPEPAFRSLMIAYRGLGDAANLANVYQRCLETLREILGIEPSSETVALYEHLSKEWISIDPLSDGTLFSSKSRLPHLHTSPPPPPAFLKAEDVPEKLDKPVFVAREHELMRLDEFMTKAFAGHGQIVFVTGDAGTGKTALLREVSYRVQEKHDDLNVALGNCNAITGAGDPYMPFREVLSILTGDLESLLVRGSITKEHARRQWSFLPNVIRAIVAHGPDLIDSFIDGFALVNRVRSYVSDDPQWLTPLQKLVERKAVNLSTDTLKQKDLFDQYTRVLMTLANQQPLLIMLDDLQWSDLGSTGLLFHLGRWVEESPILILCAYRPVKEPIGYDTAGHPLVKIVSEFKRRFGDIQIDLGRVSEGEARHFVNAYLDSEPNQLDAIFRDELLRHTGGHPLFTVELLRAMEARGDIIHDRERRWVNGPRLDWVGLPARIEGVIEERFGKLGEALEEVLTVASVEGEEFTAEVIAGVLNRDAREIIGQLSGRLDKVHRLVTARGIRRMENQRLSLYGFLHKLYHLHSYHRLDEVERAYLHEEVARVLEALYVDKEDEIAVQLAYHFTKAGINEKAVHYLCAAAERAQHLSANEEAITHLTHGLGLLEAMPPGPLRTQQELKLLTLKGVSLIATKGYASPEVEQTYSQARQLCSESDDRPQHFSILYGLRTYYLVRADYHTARELAEQLLMIAQTAEEPDLLLEAHQALGTTLFYLGELNASRSHLEEALKIYQPQQHHLHAWRYGQDPGVACLSYMALSRLWLGQSDQAKKRCREALRLAKKVAHPFSMALAQNFASILNIMCRESQAALDHAETAISISKTYGFPFWQAMGTILRGAAIVEKEAEEGLLLMHQGLAEWNTIGSELGRPFFQFLLAEALGNLGRIEDSLDVIDEALEAVDRKGEYLIKPELHRLKGELISQTGPAHADIEGRFQQAIHVARQQAALFFELRAAMSLHRLWKKHGKGKKARAMLSEVYKRFSEGFETPDIVEARKLLDLR
jgi:predicted ATPase/DNA-binding SARP family transcriptional activator